MGEVQPQRKDAAKIVETSALMSIIKTRQNHDPEIVQTHTRQIESLKKEIDERDKILSKLNKDLEDLQFTLESKNQEIEALKDKVDKLETEKKTLETKLQKFQLQLDVVKQEVAEFRDLRDQKAAIILGQMCTQVLAMRYQKLHSDKYEEDCSYSLKNIEDFEEIEDKGARQEAKNK